MSASATVYEPSGELVAGILGIIAKNPFHMKRPGKDHWRGTQRYDIKGHAVFSHEVYSARANTKDLANDYLQDGMRTLAQLFSDYAPAKDPNAKNDPAGYAAFVARRLGLSPADELPNLFRLGGAIGDQPLLLAVQQAIIEMEICRGYLVPIEILKSGHALYTRDFVTK